MNFIEKATLLHNNFYDYSLVDYKNNSTKVKIICPIHGIFEQIPKSHIRDIGRGCSKCGIEKCKRFLTQEEFISKANKVHNFFYNYDKVIYCNHDSKIIVTCKIHGDFEINPSAHINAENGCSKCANKYRRTNDEFINECKQIHNNFYDYSLTVFKSLKKKVKIICPVHGSFEQYAEHHLAEHGCARCNESKGEKIINEFLTNNNINFIKQYKFDDCRSNKNWKLIFDFYLPEHNICIEFDGLQHFKEIKYFGLESFRRTQENDKIKNQYCFEKNIRLIRIKYQQTKQKEKIVQELIPNFIL